MEAGFLNFHEGGQFPSLSSPIYSHDTMDGTNDSLLDIMKTDFPYDAAGHFDSTSMLWDNDDNEFHSEVPSLCMEPLDNTFPEGETRNTEDFQKMLTDWQDHLGSLQSTDPDEMDVVNMGMVMSKGIPSLPPENLFDDAPSTSIKKEKVMKVKEEPPFIAEDESSPHISVDPVSILDSDTGHDESQSAAISVDEVMMEIKVEDEDSVDVETFSEQMPVLEAGDLKSLLEQFEASEAVNSTTKISASRPDSSYVPGKVLTVSTKAGDSAVQAGYLSHERIRDSLPKEVIEKIKSSTRRKVVPVIPPMPTKKGAKGTRMQDAAAMLNRNKLLKLMSGAIGEAVQLDHDYCTSDVSPPSFYNSNAAEYGSGNKDTNADKVSSTEQQTCTRIPEYCIPLVQQSEMEDVKSNKDKLASCWEKNSKKDSGLESGEVSDASEETNGCGSVNERLYFDKLPPYIKDISNSSKKDSNTQQVTGASDTMKNGDDSKSIDSGRESSKSANDGESGEKEVGHLSQVEIKKSKKKLNLEEYRSRREELEKIRSTESSRASTPGTTECSSVASSSPRGNSNKPEMHSVEVQTQCDGLQSEDKDNKNHTQMDERERRMAWARERWLRDREFRAKRASRRSSSSGSSNSTHSRRSRHHSKSRSRRKRRTSQRASTGSSNSSSIRGGSRSRSGSRDDRSFWSHSPSCSSHGSSCSSSSRSKSRRKRSRSSSRHRSRSHRHHSRRRYSQSHTWRERSRSPIRKSNGWQLTEREKLRQVEERRVIYVGRLSEGTTKAELRQRFEAFGPIIDISVHFREHGDNYGFVTFGYKVDAYEAVEHGNDDPSLPKYDLCFGGRRAFCKVRYSDLDAMGTDSSGRQMARGENSFDLLLREAQAKLRKRKM